MARRSFIHLSAGLAITLFSFSARRAAGQGTDGRYSVSREILEQWIESTDAQLNFVGAPRGQALNPFEARIIWCSERRGNVCGGTCTVFTGPGDQCLRTRQKTECLAATANVTFCATRRCNEHCNTYAFCGVRLDSGFCFTPDTNSIQAPTIIEDVPAPAPAGDSESEIPTGTVSQSFQTPETNSPIPSPAPINTRTSAVVEPIFTNTAPVASGAALPESTDSSEAAATSLPVGAIAGIVLGVLFMLAASICAVLWLRYKTRRKSRPPTIDSAPRPFLAPSPASSSQPMPYSYPTDSPPMQQYHRSPPTEYDMESMYTSNPGYPLTMSSMSYATSPSVAPVPRSGPSAPAGSKGHDRVLQPVDRYDEDDDDDARSFGHYLVNPDPGFRSAPRRVDSADVRPHYS